MTAAVTRTRLFWPLTGAGLGVVSRAEARDAVSGSHRENPSPESDEGRAARLIPGVHS